ncbi:arginine--tRNA ligase [Amycolatopsis palatopharyngis]|uniref:arginine--tRNA ligase domain-containing protein n=1 Tax=Amycolatopsis palatopharyngis TaxID=187982 RepID=UPI0013BE9B65|nr:arginine--tRNA ligase [Amycolatopsis palatopharyngis]
MSVSARDHSIAINPLLQSVLPRDHRGPVYWDANGIYGSSQSGTALKRLASAGTISRWARCHSVSDLVKPWSQYLQDQSILVEHTSVNPVHPLHAGSLRGSLIGGFLVRLLRSAGARVSSRYFVNDHGRQTRLLTWILQRTDMTLLPTHLRFDHAAAVLYALVNMFQANRHQDIERLRQRHPWLEKVVSLSNDDHTHLMTSLRAREPLPQTFWHQRILRAALSDLRTIRAAVDQVEYESTLPADATVLTELASHNDVTVVNGTLCLRRHQGLIPLTRADGSWLYFTRDVLNTRRQLAQADRVIHVVGDDQALLQWALQDLFPPHTLDYVGFGVVTNQGRKFSARQNRLLTITDILEKHGTQGLWQLAFALTIRRRQTPIDLPDVTSAGLLPLIIQARRTAENGHGVSRRSQTSDDEAWPVLCLLLRTPATLLRSLQERSPHPVTQLLLHVSRAYLRAAHQHRVTPRIQTYFLEIQHMLADLHGLPLQILAGQDKQVEESPA